MRLPLKSFEIHSKNPRRSSKLLVQDRQDSFQSDYRDGAAQETSPDLRRSENGRPRIQTVRTVDSLDSVEEVCRVWREFLQNPLTFLPSKGTER